MNSSSSRSSMSMPMPMDMPQMHMGMNNNCEMNQMMHPIPNFPMKWEPCTPPDEKPHPSMLFPPLSGIFNQSRHSSTGEGRPHFNSPISQLIHEAKFLIIRILKNIF